MVALTTPKFEKNSLAPEFNLLEVGGLFHSLQKLKGEKGTVIVFMCNHCPYVKSIIDKIVLEARELENIGVKLIGINSNDDTQYPEDSYSNMQKFSKIHNFSFPYLFDFTQEVAKEYGAVCTPDFFGFDASMKLQYRGRICSPNPQSNSARELFIAMKAIAETGVFNEVQHPSIGCSIKWRNE